MGGGPWSPQPRSFGPRRGAADLRTFFCPRRARTKKKTAGVGEALAQGAIIPLPFAAAFVPAVFIAWSFLSKMCGRGCSAGGGLGSRRGKRRSNLHGDLVVADVERNGRAGGTGSKTLRSLQRFHQPSHETPSVVCGLLVFLLLLTRGVKPGPLHLVVPEANGPYISINPHKSSTYSRQDLRRFSAASRQEFRRVFDRRPPAFPQENRGISAPLPPRFPRRSEAWFSGRRSQGIRRVFHRARPQCLQGKRARKGWRCGKGREASEGTGFSAAGGEIAGDRVAERGAQGGMQSEGSGLRRARTLVW